MFEGWLKYLPSHVHGLTIKPISVSAPLVKKPETVPSRIRLYEKYSVIPLLTRSPQMPLKST